VIDTTKLVHSKSPDTFVRLDTERCYFHGSHFRTDCPNSFAPNAYVHAGAYGSTKRYKTVQRVYEVNKACVVGASGELSDFQQLQRYLDQLTTDDFIADDGIELTPREVHSYLTRVMYNRRNKCVSHIQ
jgi:hypothetical protein